MESNVVIYDIFCDASVGPTLKGCCSGALIERRNPVRNYPERIFHYTIQPNGTNNSGEAAAVAMGVGHAVLLNSFMKERGYDPKFNIFSDSLISINGSREWLPNWVKNSDNLGNLRNYSGGIVANQEYFKYIFNSILVTDIDIHFFHQDGHVLHNFEGINKSFRKQNGVYPIDIGKTPASLCLSNDYVDKETRKLINMYLNCPKEDLPKDWHDDRLSFIVNSFKCDTICDRSKEAIELYRNKVAYHGSQ